MKQILITIVSIANVKIKDHSKLKASKIALINL